MKIYFILLAILFLSTTVTRLLLLTIASEPALSQLQAPRVLPKLRCSPDGRWGGLAGRPGVA